MKASTVFVYHAQDHEGSLLADFLRKHDEEQRFEFLSLTTDEEMEHNVDFLRRTGIHEKVHLPYIVMVPATADADRVVIHGTRFHEWMGGLIEALYVHDPVALLDTCKWLFPLHLGPPLLRLIEMLARSVPPADAVCSQPPPPPPPASQVVREEKTTPVRPTQQPPQSAIANRHTGGRVIKEQAHSSLQYVLDADPDDDAIVDSTMPVTSGGEAKAVNVAAVIAGEGRQRELQQQYKPGDEMRKD